MEQNLYINQVVYASNDEQLYRVLWVSPGQEYGYWISMEKQNRVPVKFIYREVAAGLSDGTITVTEDPVRINDGDVSADAREKRDEWWHILKPVLECEPDVYERRRRGELVSEAARRSCKDKADLYHYLVKYWKKGKTPNAFLQDFRNCGRGAKTQNDRKLGRPVKHEGGFGKILTDEDIKHFGAAIKKYYLNRRSVTIHHFTTL